ncbi:tapasin-related protein [Spea bombifrons]|uniref:tapasin-related protein n=1 Tax=Spea bombifrons TaxID=233779 RepID=UPI0023499CB9|nr:tapasin-related protein [Spea bombifrons]
MDSMRNYDFIWFRVMLTLYGLQGLSADLAGGPRVVDVVLPCSHVLKGENGGGGVSFPREDITLVLSNIEVTGEGGLDPGTDYVPPQDKETTTFQATVNWSPLPFAERLIHAECEGEDLLCELSHLYTQFYVVFLHLPDLSISLLLEEDQPAGDAATESVPSQPRIIPTTVKLLLSSSSPSLLTPISVDVSLGCEVWGDTEGLSVEWHLQKEGKGQKVVPEDGSRISIDPGTLQHKRDMSLIIKGVRVEDEGTYICTVTSRQHYLQQVLKLQIMEPPLVSVILTKTPEPRLICRTDRYYPLDVEVEWLLNGSAVTHSTPVTSSHRRNSDGTYNLTSYLTIPSQPEGASHDIYTCTVSHVSIGEPVQVQFPLQEEDTSYGIAVLIIPLLIIIAVKMLFKF